jgi:hypothetical protein
MRRDGDGDHWPTPRLQLGNRGDYSCHISRTRDILIQIKAHRSRSAQIERLRMN